MELSPTLSRRGVTLPPPEESTTKTPIQSLCERYGLKKLPDDSELQGDLTDINAILDGSFKVTQDPQRFLNLLGKVGDYTSPDDPQVLYDSDEIIEFKKALRSPFIKFYESNEDQLKEACSHHPVHLVFGSPRIVIEMLNRLGERPHALWHGTSAKANLCTTKFFR